MPMIAAIEITILGWLSENPLTRNSISVERGGLLETTTRLTEPNAKSGGNSSRV